MNSFSVSTERDIRKAVSELRAIVARQAGGKSDKEADHSDADSILLSLLPDEIVKVYFEIDKWYA